MSRTLLINPTAMEAGLTAAAKARATSPARAAAFGRFAKTGLPSRRAEAWKWTDLRAALREEIRAASADNDVIGPSHLAGVETFEITIMNGRAEWAGSPPDGVAIALGDGEEGVAGMAGEHPTAALAAALAERRLEITIAAGAKTPRWIHVRRIAGPGAHHQRLAVRVGRNARARVIETFDGVGRYFSNSLTEIRLDAGAALERAMLADGSDEGVETHVAAVELAAGADLRQTALMFGARLMRLETAARVAGAGASIGLDSAALVRGARHADMTSLVRFDAPGAMAAQRHKAALDERGRGVFQGKFQVARGAQKTEARMRAGALLLSEAAEADHKPELEIYADDVACAHGAATGALDADALFYLRQRGLDAATARALLVEAFVGEAFDGVADAALAAAFGRRASRWLGRTP
jgi:Fe-S cluster assembly protein SufD